MTFKLSCRILEPHECMKAQALLYQVYVNELSWNPPPGNPSGWRKDSKNGELILTDRYDSVASWFGVFNEQQDLVATCRLVRPHDNRLEIENYQQIQKIYLLDRSKNFEMNRLAVAADYRQSPATIQLLLMVLEFLAAKDAGFLFIAPSYPSPADICLRLGFHATEPQVLFRYHKSDPHEVQLLWFDCRDKVALERIIATCGRALERFAS